MRVVYIMGFGRSGSTVLDTLLGNHPAIESVGELFCLPRHGWTNGEYCACGRRGNVCPFWSKVRGEWIRRTGVDDVEGYQRLIDTFEGARFWIPLLSKQRWRPSPQFRAYSRQTRTLFEAIRAVSGKSIIVDSSKRNSRAFALALTPGVDLRVIYLMRDARGVAWSMKKGFKKDDKAGVARNMKPRQVWRASINWMVGNLRSQWVCRQLPDSCWTSVRYEDYVADPKEALTRIGRFIGVEAGPLSEAAGQNRPMAVGHTISGNRLRMAGSVKLRADTEWMVKMSPLERWLCWAITGRLLRRNGYRRRPQSVSGDFDSAALPQPQLLEGRRPKCLQQRAVADGPGLERESTI